MCVKTISERIHHENNTSPKKVASARRAAPLPSTNSISDFKKTDSTMNIEPLNITEKGA